jgi:Fe-S cluster biosynthesis and repair protein YggX
MKERQGMPRMVMCAKLGRELPGLEEPPFPGELGQRIYENISQAAWNMWPQQATIVMNHYGLNMADPAAQGFLMEQMEDFFFGPGAQMPPGWTAPGQSAKGGAAPAPSAKGGAAPPRKK